MRLQRAKWAALLTLGQGLELALQGPERDGQAVAPTEDVKTKPAAFDGADRPFNRGDTLQRFPLKSGQ